LPVKALKNQGMLIISPVRIARYRAHGVTQKTIRELPTVESKPPAFMLIAYLA